MVERARPIHFRYCGTANPDAFLLEKAYKFVSEFLEPVSNVGLKNSRKIRVPASPSQPKKARQGAGEAWIRLFSEYQGDECLVYPFVTAASPRGSLVFNFKSMQAHRAMCLAVNKLPPQPDMLALHRCGNGHLGCVSPSHLYWGTKADNGKDASRHMKDGKPSCVSAAPEHKHHKRAA